ncbi:MAG: RNA polymerase sigma factor [Bacteroidales bacterium]|nr:RNA polymerase sigma factor [Bacteroidales bacterium]MCR5243853.1 RNA polymerase sigma factor [Bacteroidales bacterium]MDT3357125.1 RNA polymerase sigma factor [Bacteroidota bacterium]
MQRFGWNLHLVNRETKKEKPGTDSGSDLVDACRKGDRKAQKRLYDALAPKMFAVCLRYMGQKDAAEDILQEGFVTLFTKLESYSGEGSFEGWARKIFVNTALMDLRKNDALKMSEDLESARDISGGAATQMENLGYRELLGLISELPAGFRTVFNMYVIEGYSHKEIADTLGITEGTSRSQLQRARTLLQDKIKKRQDARHE